jgi:two-component system, chemotaxis family, protein-glutamate methylesterase/glutaminase
MPRIKILVTDDSVVIRQLLLHILSEDPELEVIGTAPDGNIALAKIPQLNPDLVLLDLEMPHLDGMETLKRIRVDYPELPVIMFSSYTRQGAEVTMDALLLGAQDYEEKPSHFSNRADAIQHVKENLIPKIKAICSVESVKKPIESSRQPAPSYSPRIARALGPVDAVVIGVSTGGPTALATILSALPAPFPVPIYIVQHMPPLFTDALAQRLTLKTAFQVKEGRDEEILEPGAVRLAPGDYHMTLRFDDETRSLRTQLSKGQPVNSCRPSVDVLFHSAAEIYGDRLLAVVLTGMGQDGLKGCELIREKGGQIVVQDEATSTVWGMPGAVAQAGLADEVLPLEKIAGEISRRVHFHRNGNRNTSESVAGKAP